MKKFLTPLLFLLIATVSHSASVVNTWVTWDNPGSFPNTSDSGYTYARNVVGTLQIAGTVNTATVSLSGEASDTLSVFSGLTAGGSSADNIWSFYNQGTFTSSNVPSLPNADFIFAGGYGNPVQHLSFSQPIDHLVMSIWSLGAGGVPGAFNFDHPFVVLSEDLGRTYFGVGGNVLAGEESSGTIQFTGPISSLSWSIPEKEWGFGWTIGTTTADAPLTSLVPVNSLSGSYSQFSNLAVPEPSTYALFGLGALGLVLAARRKRA